MTLHRPVAIVTGGGTGVGAATSLLLAQRGYNVVVNYVHSAETAEQVAQECRALGVDSFCVQGDVAEDDDCCRIVDSALSRWVRMDALVNCAGITKFASLQDPEALTAHDFLQVYAISVVGPFQMARAFARHAAEGSAIVNISSVAGAGGTGSDHAYAAANGALGTLTLSLARNLAPKIRVNAVVPGMIQGCRLNEDQGDEAYERTMTQFEDQSALGHVCTPEEVASAVVWLAADASTVTGQLIAVDAGLTLGRPLRLEK